MVISMAPFMGPVRGNTLSGSIDEHRLLERALLVFFGLVEVHGVMRAVDQHHLHGAFRLVEQQASLLAR